MEIEVIAGDLEWPEGPVWMTDGSIVLVEAAAGRISRIYADGSRETVARPGGGPNGGAIGPDGLLYVCNNGGMVCHRMDGMTVTAGDAPDDYETGRIERVNLKSGAVERLYDTVEGRHLAGPNDIVFDDQGGFWFSDVGKHRGNHTEDGGIFYAKADGSKIERVVDRVGANGIGLSPDAKRLYVAVTFERLLLAFEVPRAGTLTPPTFLPGQVVASFPGRQYLDSLAITEDGQICVATCIEGAGIASVDPVTGACVPHALPDLSPTNICFGGSDMQDAWITLSATGRLIKVRWDRPGLKLAHYA